MLLVWVGVEFYKSYRIYTQGYVWIHLVVELGYFAIIREVIMEIKAVGGLGVTVLLLLWQTPVTHMHPNTRAVWSVNRGRDKDHRLVVPNSPCRREAPCWYTLPSCCKQLVLHKWEYNGGVVWRQRVISPLSLVTHPCLRAARSCASNPHDTQPCNPGALSIQLHPNLLV